MMHRATLRQTAVFHAVAQAGSIAAAAARLGRSPPALHHDLKALERHLGRPLFERAGRSLRLTAAARPLYDELTRNLDGVARALDRFARQAEADDGLRIAAVSGFGRYRLAPCLFAAAGGRSIDLLFGAHDQVLCMLAEGRVDAAVTYKPVVAVPFTARALTNEGYVLVGSDGMAVGDDIGSIRTLRFVTYDEYEYVFAAWFQGRFGEQPRRLPRSDHTGELEEALASVAAGRGVTIVPADAWRNGAWRNHCRQIDTGPPVTNDLYVLARSDSRGDTASFILSLFADCALSEMDQDIS